MLCPNCNTEVTESKFCENCGAALSAVADEQPAAADEQPAAAVEEPTTAAEQPATPFEQPATPVEQPAAPFGQPTAQIPQPGAFAPAPAATQPSSTPFVLAIIALVTAIMGLFPISIILAIIALVMNSGQKKRGEFSTKQTPTFVMSLISLILSVIMALIIALVVGVIGVAAVNGEFDDLESAIESAQTSTSSSAAASSSSSLAFTPDDLVGSWRLSGLVQDGTSTNAESIAKMQDMGLEVSLNLHEDGTATLVLFGAEMTGTWDAPSSNTVNLSLDGLEGICSVDTATGELTLTDGDDKLTFTKE